jgi:hypothetical protein
MSKKRRDWVWVLGKDEKWCEIFPLTRKPTINAADHYIQSDAKTYMDWEWGVCKSWFERITGLRVKPGELRKMRIHAEWVE